MSKINTFEEIQAWQKARILSKEIYRISGLGSFSKDFALRDQMRRAAISISSNIAEGFERSGRKEFIHFLSISKASAGELRSQLYLSFDLEYINKEEFDSLLSITIETGKMISGLMSYLNKSEYTGTKFKEITTQQL